MAAAAPSDARRAPDASVRAPPAEPAGARLPMPAGTELLVDETQMDEGQLTERGVANLQAIAQLIKEGQLGLDFEYLLRAISMSTYPHSF